MACDSIGTVLNLLRQRRLSGWLCLLSFVLHLTAPLCHASFGLNRACNPTRVTLTVYDVFGQIQQVTHPDNTVVSTDYTHHGNPWKVVDELGRLTQTEFDAAGRAVKSIAPAIGGVSAITTTEHDAAGNVIRVTDALGHVTESQYDERNRAVAVYAPPVWNAETGHFVRPATQSSYDALGQVLTVTDPQGYVTTHSYDRAGRGWKVVAPMVDGLSPKTVTKFDPGGLALSVTNPLGQTVTNTYDLHGRMTQTVDAVGIVNTFAHDAAGNRTSVKDGKNQETTFGYDGLNRLTWQTFANGDTTIYAYNAVRKLSQTSPRGITTSYTYDGRDRVLTTSAPGLNRSYSYDVAGHLLGVDEGVGHEPADVSYEYDELGRVSKETSRGVQHRYSYDLAGNRVRADYGTGRSVQTSYDALGRPESIVEGGRATRYGYDLAGRAVILVAGNGQTSQNSYDALGRLVDRTLFKTTAMGESEVLAQFSWTHDALGNVRQQLEKWSGDFSRSESERDTVRSTTMTYDADNRLSTETIAASTAGVTTTTTTVYAYDAANNRSSKTVTGGSDPGVWQYTYNVANQLVRWELRGIVGGDLVKSASLVYDGAGNRVAQTVEKPADSEGNQAADAYSYTTYQWDAQDRLQSVTMPDNIRYTNEYDYRTRRIGTQQAVDWSGVQQRNTAIVFAGGLSLAEYDSTTDTLPATPTVEYTRGPDMGGGVGGMLYSMRASGTKYSLSNGRGDIVAQADSSATLTWTASYEAYGRRTTETGSNQDKQRGNSKDEDPTGLLNEGFRYRDLETGVWMSRDPAGFVDGPNVYAYVKQNPWTGFDPDGLKTQQDYHNDMQRAGRERAAENKAIGPNASEKMKFGVENRYKNKMWVAQQGINKITATAREMERVSRMTAGSIHEGLLDDENESYVKFNRLGAVASLPIFNSALGEHANHWEKEGEMVGLVKEVAKEIVIAFATLGLGKAIKAARGPKCFAAGTKVQTSDGEKNIEELRGGDTVYAYDFDASSVVERRVLETVSNFTYFWADVEVGGDVLHATRGHKFWVESEDEWIAAAALTPGMNVRLSDGRISSVTKVSVRQLVNPERTYSLVVEKDHNYFVGNVGVLVHNGGPDFIVTPSGQTFPVPSGAQGPVSAVNPAGKTMGFGFRGGSGGNGLDPNVTNLTFKDANWNQGGRAAYYNKARQKVNPYTGKPIGNADAWAHIPCP